jgi:DNA-binding transcriptional LysR family regulator
LKINTTIGFVYFVLSETLPTFLERYPDIDVSLDLTSRPVDLVAEGIDVTIRMGNLPHSRLIATGLGTMQKYLCAAPSYLDRRGVPQSIKELKKHDTIETPCKNGTPRTWAFYKNAQVSEEFEVAPVEINIVYPSNRGLSPPVRAFVEQMKQTAAAGKLWLDDPIEKVSHSPLRPRYPSKRSRAKSK